MEKWASTLVLLPLLAKRSLPSSLPCPPRNSPPWPTLCCRPFLPRVGDPGKIKLTLAASRSIRYAGSICPTAPSSFCLTLRSSYALSVFFICTFSACRFLCSILALWPNVVWDTVEALWASRAVRLRLMG